MKITFSERFQLRFPENSTYTLTAVGSTADGANGLPSITSDITIIGNGAVINRNSAASASRLFHIAANGSLTLENVTVSGGDASGAAPADDGGAIYNRGTLLPTQVAATAEPVLMTDTATTPPLVLPTDTVTNPPPAVFMMKETTI